VSVEAQRGAKRDVVIDALTRIGKLGPAESLVADVAVLGPEQSRRARDGVEYRSRIRLREAGSGEWGLFAERSHKVVPVPGCLVCVEAINEAWSSLPQGPAVVNLSSEGNSVAISTADVSDACERSVRGVDGRTWRWSIPADSFWQVHVDLPQYLVDFLSRYVRAGSVWWDLYGGAGLMSAGAISAGAQTVHLVERDSRSIAAAKDAFATTGRVHIHAADVGAWLNADTVASGSRETPSGVILDPPRAGAGPEVIAGIARWRPDTIIYVACDPASLARDTAALRDRHYGLRVVQPIDAFPMTHHVETIAVFAPGVDRHP